MSEIFDCAYPIPRLSATLALRSSENAIVDCERGYNLTYSELAKVVETIAEVLSEFGLPIDCRIMITAESSPAVLICMLAIWQANMVPVPLAKIPDRLEQLRIFNQCRIGAILCDSKDLQNVAIDIISQKEIDINIARLNIATFRDNNFEVDDLFLRDKLALIAYTSGTTGDAKGVMLGAGAISYASESMSEVVASKSGDRVLTPLSSSHLYGIIANCYLLSTKATIYFCNVGSSELELLSYVKNYSLNAILIQPQHVKKLVEARSPLECNSIRYLSCASGGVSLLESAALARVFPDAHQFFYYALSEAPRAVFIKDPHRLHFSEMPLGCPAPGMILKLDNEGIHDERSIGEILVSGPAVALGYVGNTIASDEKFIGDTFRTGDAGEEISGEIFYRGRMADIITWDNKRISAWETEMRLAMELERKGVIIGLVDGEFKGTKILRVIVEGPLTVPDYQKAKSITQPIATQLKLPLQIKTVLALPRNSSGKILRHQALNALGS